MTMYETFKASQIADISGLVAVSFFAGFTRQNLLKVSHSLKYGALARAVWTEQQGDGSDIDDLAFAYAFEVFNFQSCQTHFADSPELLPLPQFQPPMPVGLPSMLL